MAFVCEEHGDTRRLAQGKCRSEFTKPCCGRLVRGVASGNASMSPLISLMPARCAVLLVRPSRRDVEIVLAELLVRG